MNLLLAHSKLKWTVKQITRSECIRVERALSLCEIPPWCKVHGQMSLLDPFPDSATNLRPPLGQL